MRHYRASKPEYKARARAWAKNNPEKRRAIMRRHMYGCEPTRPCPELCEICNRSPATDLDHDHVTGKFRGWLCNPCNSGLGQFKDNPRDLRMAALYVELTK